MICPHCQKVLPDQKARAWCPACGRDLQDTTTRQNRLVAVAPNYLRVICLLAAPAIVTVILASLEWWLLAIFGILGSIAAGIYCARLVLWESDITGIKRVLLQFAVALGLGIVSLTISFAGCSVVHGRS